jgi:hypothetical protein
MMIWKDVKGNGCGFQHSDRLRAGWPEFDSWQGQEFFCTPYRLYRLWDPPGLLSNGYRGLFPGEGVKRLGRAADRSPPSGAKVKNGEAIPPLPYASSWHCA